tara:strand:- start:257 stop:574 length:318 start_codon:yes stop_codon:yes gene_type:complete
MKKCQEDLRLQCSEQSRQSPEHSNVGHTSASEGVDRNLSFLQRRGKRPTVTQTDDSNRPAEVAETNADVDQSFLGAATVQFIDADHQWCSLNGSGQSSILNWQEA